MTPRAILAWSWTVIVLCLCWLPHSYLPDNEELTGPFEIPHLDKVVHFGSFMIWGFLWMRVSQPPHHGRRILLAGLALAILTELGQMMPIVGRDAGFDDGAADMIGLSLGLFATYFLEGTFARSFRLARYQSPVGRPGRNSDHEPSNLPGLVVDDRPPVALLAPSDVYPGEPGAIPVVLDPPR